MGHGSKTDEVIQQVFDSFGGTIHVGTETVWLCLDGEPVARASIGRSLHDAITNCVNQFATVATGCAWFLREGGEQ